MTTDGDAHKSVPLQTLFKVGYKKMQNNKVRLQFIIQ